MNKLFESTGSTFHVEIIINGGLEYDAMLTVDEITELLQRAEKLERNTAYDLI